MPRLGLTVKDGVFSVWKGQRPFQCSPARFRFTKLADELHDVERGADLVEDSG